MEYGISSWSNIALRADASHCSEMVSQLLFGETYSVLEATAEWLKISTTACQYEGWISKKQHTALDEKAFGEYEAQPKVFVHDLITRVYNTTELAAFPIFFGSQFPVPDNNGNFILAGKEYAVETPSAAATIPDLRLADQQDRLLYMAFKFLNTPYLWGGRTPAGIDCSGFTQTIFRSIGKMLPRDASQQFELGSNVDFVEEARIGDIAFFDNEEGHIVHVGIVCGKNEIIHASGHVQVNALDETGIFNKELKRYTHHLRIVKRIL